MRVQQVVLSDQDSKLSATKIIAEGPGAIFIIEVNRVGINNFSRDAAASSRFTGWFRLLSAWNNEKLPRRRANKIHSVERWPLSLSRRLTLKCETDGRDQV
jgi:hypothetical protein